MFQPFLVAFVNARMASSKADRDALLQALWRLWAVTADDF
jgi:hypothetical protein